MSKVNKNPVVTSYRSVQDLLTLKEWLYNFNETLDNRHRGIQRIKALGSRGRLPHAVEITALLTSVTLSDPHDKGNFTKQYDANILQLSYTMALIRFVNGLLDPFQQSNFAIPLHQLARNLKLPSLFVELRHMGTHEALPNLDILRIAKDKAMNWLFDNYWLTLNENLGYDDEEGDDEEGSNNEIGPVEGKLSEKDEKYVSKEYNKLAEVCDKIISGLKTFKKIRKQDLDKDYKYGNTTEIGSKYWKAIKSIKYFYEDDKNTLQIVQTLMYKNFLIYNFDKLDTTKKPTKKLNSLLIKLYKPLLDEFGIRFKVLLLFSIFYTLNHNEGDSPEVDLDTLVNYRIGFTIRHPDEITQLLDWTKYLMEDLISYEPKFSFTTMRGRVIDSRVDIIETLLNDIPSVVNSKRLEVLIALETSFIKSNLQNDTIKHQIKEAITNMKRELKIKNFAPPPSLDDILGLESSSDQQDEPSQLKRKQSEVDDDVKRYKSDDKVNSLPSTCYLFEPAKDWQPTAFGTFT
ncbi:protein Las1p [[Candida] anglica]|uniref:Protein Las1p n=1 Tax=[Candida] anglica TaxID=148631 RepID=A0ABP0EJN5_9ASCO